MRSLRADEGVPGKLIRWDLSAAIVFKRIFFAAQLTVRVAARLETDRIFNKLSVPETIEWE